jgi:hypothetical protein
MRTHWRSRQSRRHLHRERSGTGDRRKGLLGLRSSPGNFAIFSAMRGASSRVSHSFLSIGEVHKRSELTRAERRLTDTAAQNAGYPPFLDFRAFDVH